MATLLTVVINSEQGVTYYLLIPSFNILSEVKLTLVALVVVDTQAALVAMATSLPVVTNSEQDEADTNKKMFYKSLLIPSFSVSFEVKLSSKKSPSSSSLLPPSSSHWAQLGDKSS